MDSKFIACVLPSDSGDILVLLDQHAADERVSVESIFQELCEGFLNGNMPVTQLTKKEPMIIVSKDEAEILRMPGILEVFERWGICLELAIGHGDYCQLAIKAVPTVLVSRLGRKEGNEMKRLIKLYLPVLQRSLEEIQLALRRASGDEEVDSWRMMRWMPEEMLELANSKACRSELYSMVLIMLIIIRLHHVW